MISLNELVYFLYPSPLFHSRQTSVCVQALFCFLYMHELQLNKANSSDTKAPFLDLNLSIRNGIACSKIYDKRDYLNFEIVNFPFFDGDVPRSPSYGVYISRLIRLARVC